MSTSSFLLMFAVLFWAMAFALAIKNLIVVQDKTYEGEDKDGFLNTHDILHIDHAGDGSSVYFHCEYPFLITLNGVEVYERRPDRLYHSIEIDVKTGDILSVSDGMTAYFEIESNDNLMSFTVSRGTDTKRLMWGMTAFAFAVSIVCTILYVISLL